MQVNRGIRGERGQIIEVRWAKWFVIVVSLELSACQVLHVCEGGLTVIIFGRVASLMIYGGKCSAVYRNSRFGRYSTEKTGNVGLSQRNAS